MAPINTAYDEVKKYTNEELHKVLSELHGLSISSTPAKLKQSAKMKKLFTLEKAYCNYWSEQFQRVSMAVNTEIVQRFYNKTL